MTPHFGGPFSDTIQLSSGHKFGCKHITFKLTKTTVSTTSRRRRYYRTSLSSFSHQSLSILASIALASFFRSASFALASSLVKDVSSSHWMRPKESHMLRRGGSGGLSELFVYLKHEPQPEPESAANASESNVARQTKAAKREGGSKCPRSHLL